MYPLEGQSAVTGRRFRSPAVPPRWGVLIVLVLASVVGLVLNPWVVKPYWMSDPVGDGILIALGLAGIAWCSGVCLARLRGACDCSSADVPAADLSTLSPRRHWPIVAVWSVILVLWLAMFRERWSRPEIKYDDYHYITIGATWSSTTRNLFNPFNEHFCVPTRLLTWGLCATVEPSRLPGALAVAGMLLFASAFVPLFVFVRRECNSPAMGLLAVSIYALTPVHQEVVMWYSASQWCWALVLLLVALLMVPAGVVRMTAWRLGGVVLLAAIAPFTYAVGLLVGPVTSLYLIVRRCVGQLAARPACCVLPALATVVVVLTLACWKGPDIARRAKYGGRRPADAIAPLSGVLYGMRSTVDTLVLRNLGFRPVSRLPRVCYAVVFLIVIFGLGELIRRAVRPGLLILGWTLVLLPYAMMLPFRVWVQYEDFTLWSRYQLFPQLGVALIVCGAVAEFGPRWLRGPVLSARQITIVLSLAIVQFLVHQVA